MIMVRDVIIIVLTYVVGICVGFGFGYDKVRRGDKHDD